MNLVRSFVDSSRCLTGAFLVATTIAACGGAPPGTGAHEGNTRSADPANLAREAVDPRTGDPTAAAPSPVRPAAGASASLGPSPSSSASAPPPGPLGTSETANGDASPEAGTSHASLKTAEPLKKISARHVLIQWIGTERAPASVVRSRDQALAVAQEVLRRVRNNEDFARLAIEFSDEPGAGGRGGSLGRFGRGQMVGAFEEAAFSLEVGQISDIVESPFGFHIIQRTE